MSVFLSSGLVHAQTATVPVTAQADDETPSGSGGEVLPALDRPGLEFAARFGFALPLGYLAGSAQISNGLSGIVPLGLGVGVRANKNVALGLGIDFAPGVTKNCSSVYGCFAMDYRLGVEVMFTSRSVRPLNPWVGLGFGY